jgi:hypothetical protein
MLINLWIPKQRVTYRSTELLETTAEQPCRVASVTGNKGMSDIKLTSTPAHTPSTKRLTKWNIKYISIMLLIRLGLNSWLHVFCPHRI